MKIIRKGFEREVTCPRCKALLSYVTKDIHLVGDMESNYSYCVKCPECGKEIELCIRFVPTFLNPRDS